MSALSSFGLGYTYWTVVVVLQHAALAYSTMMRPLAFLEIGLEKRIKSHTYLRPHVSALAALRQLRLRGIEIL